MINRIQHGSYRLIETKGQTKILTLDNKQTFAWVAANDIGEILVASHKTHKADHILATGAYNLYEVREEPDLVDLQHLELAVGDRLWQGYLLTTGLPDSMNKRNRIIPTSEIITQA